ncbi:MAG: phasin family protein [Rickettsiales bacterium]
MATTNKAYNNVFKNDMFKAFGEFKAPSIDMSGWLATGRKNAEAFSAVNQMMLEGMQAVTRRQTEIMQENVEEFLKTTKDLLTNNSPEMNTQKQAAFTRSAYENSVSSAREISEMISKSCMDAFDLINKRASQSMEEITRLSKKAAA